MKSKLLLALATLSIFQAKASFLRAAVVVAGLTSSAYYNNQIHQVLGDKKFQKQSLQDVVKQGDMFDEERQILLREILIQEPLDKPIYFGLGDGYRALSFDDAYYVTLDRRNFPTVVIIDIPLFKKNVARDGAIITHEIGHLVFRHAKARIDNALQVTTVSALAGTALNGYLITKAFQSTSRLDTAGKLLAMGAFAITIALASTYQITALSRRTEREADTYAHERSTVEQLERMKEELTKYIGKEKMFFHPHPTPAERIATLEKIIATKKQGQLT